MYTFLTLKCIIKTKFESVRPHGSGENAKTRPNIAAAMLWRHRARRGTYLGELFLSHNMPLKMYLYSFKNSSCKWVNLKIEWTSDFQINF